MLLAVWHCRRATKGRRKGKSRVNYPAKRLTRDGDDSDAISGKGAELPLEMRYCLSYSLQAILSSSQVCLLAKSVHLGCNSTYKTFWRRFLLSAHGKAVLQV